MIDWNKILKELLAILLVAVILLLPISIIKRKSMGDVVKSTERVVEAVVTEAEEYTDIIPGMIGTASTVVTSTNYETVLEIPEVEMQFTYTDEGMYRECRGHINDKVWVRVTSYYYENGEVTEHVEILNFEE